MFIFFHIGLISNGNEKFTRKKVSAKEAIKQNNIDHNDVSLLNSSSKVKFSPVNIVFESTPKSAKKTLENGKPNIQESKSPICNDVSSQKISALLKKRKQCSNVQQSENDLSKNSTNAIDHKASPSKKLKCNKIIETLIDNEKGSIELAEECFAWMISPMKVKSFMRKYWEQKPLYIQREDNAFYKHIFSCKAFDELLRNSDKPMIFGKVCMKFLLSIRLVSVLKINFFGKCLQFKTVYNHIFACSDEEFGHYIIQRGRRARNTYTRWRSSSCFSRVGLLQQWLQHSHYKPTNVCRPRLEIMLNITGE